MEYRLVDRRNRPLFFRFEGQLAPLFVEVALHVVAESDAVIVEYVAAPVVFGGGAAAVAVILRYGLVVLLEVGAHVVGAVVVVMNHEREGLFGFQVGRFAGNTQREGADDKGALGQFQNLGNLLGVGRAGISKPYRQKAEKYRLTAPFSVGTLPCR